MNDITEIWREVMALNAEYDRLDEADGFTKFFIVNERLARCLGKPGGLKGP